MRSPFRWAPLLVAFAASSLAQAATYTYRVAAPGMAASAGATTPPPAEPQACSLPWGGGQLASGTSYGSLVHPSSTDCTSVTLTCTNGTLNYPNASTTCTPSDPSWASVTGLFHMEDLTDASGKNSLTAVGAATLSSTAKMGSKSLYVNGSGSYLSMPDSDNYYLNGGFTVEAWVYIAGGTAGIQAIVNQRPTASQGTQFIVVWDGVSYYQAAWIDNTWVITRNTGTVLPPNQWLHLVWQHSGTTYSTFVNGVLNQSRTDAKVASNGTAPVTIGGDATAYGQHFKGYIDDVRITKGVARYPASGFTPPTAPFPDH